MSVREKFSARLLIDYDFYNTVIKTSTDSLMMKLMYINGRSEEYKRKHNLMCSKSFEKILSSKTDKEEKSQLEAILKASFKPLDEPREILNVENEIERNIKFAIELAFISPFRTIILTTDEKKEVYEENPHYTDVKPVFIKSGNDAVLLIESYYKKVILT